MRELIHAPVELSCEVLDEQVCEVAPSDVRVVLRSQHLVHPVTHAQDGRVQGRAA